MKQKPKLGFSFNNQIFPYSEGIRVNGKDGVLGRIMGQYCVWGQAEVSDRAESVKR